MMMRQLTSLRATTLLIVTLLVCAPSVGAKPSTGEISDYTEYRHRFEIQAGYFTGGRLMFRELYGNSMTFGIRYQRLAANRLGYGIRGGVTKLRRSDGAPSLLSISLTPMISYDMHRKRGDRVFASIGVGMSRRAISVTLPRTYEGSHEVIGYLAVRQTQLSILTMIELGVDMRLGPQWSLGGRVCYDYFPFGDPTRGDFGDTGGVYFLGSIIHGFGH